MKKITTIAVLVIFITLSASALNVNFHGGLISGVGISEAYGKWNVGIDYESTIPFYAIGSGFVGVYFEDCSYFEGVKIGLFFFRGIDLYAYRSIFETEKISIGLGLNSLSGLEIPINKFQSTLKAGLSVNYKIDKESYIYGMVNIPFASITVAEGFATPFIQVPTISWMSVGTGSKVGYCHKL